MTRVTLASTLLSLPLRLACPDPPPDIAPAADEVGRRRLGKQGGTRRRPIGHGSVSGVRRSGHQQVVPQKTQEEWTASGEALVTLSGELRGCRRPIRIGVIEVGVEHTDSGPWWVPCSALPGAGRLLAGDPGRQELPISALCDIDNDGKIVQDKDKLAPGVAIGEVTEDRDRIILVFPGRGEPVQIGDPNDGTKRLRVTTPRRFLRPLLARGIGTKPHPYRLLPEEPTPEDAAPAEAVAPAEE